MLLTDDLSHETQHVAHPWAWALGVHVLSWYAQIHPGHLVLEKRKPALLDSFFQVHQIPRVPSFVTSQMNTCELA